MGVTVETLRRPATMAKHRRDQLGLRGASAERRKALARVREMPLGEPMVSAPQLHQPAAHMKQGSFVVHAHRQGLELGKKCNHATGLTQSGQREQVV